MRTRYLLIVGVLALSLALAGCMGGGGDANASADADGNGSMDGDDGSVNESMDAEDGTMDGSMGGSTMAAGFLGGQGCEAGQEMTFTELRQQAEFQMSTAQAPETNEVSGTVTTNGKVQHDGHETCHVTVEYDEAIGGDGMSLERVEIYAGADDYVDMQYFDTSGTQRLGVTIENNETSTTIYDEDGNEMQMPSGGQMPSGDYDY